MAISMPIVVAVVAGISGAVMANTPSQAPVPEPGPAEICDCTTVGV
jgi:hypothetical protein